MRCILCNSKIAKEIKIEKNYYYCGNCEVIFVDQEEILSPAEEIKRYRMHDNTHDNKGYVNMFRKFITEVIKPYQGKINSVLDFGCGPGPVLADMLEDMGFKVDIYDPYFYKQKIYQGKKYDLITSTEVFEHLKDPVSIIETLITHLKEGGYLAVMTSYHPGPEDLKEWYYIWDPTHIIFYNSTTVRWIADYFKLDLVYQDNEKYCLFQNVKF